MNKHNDALIGVTLADVAQHAGVSPATVSRYLNNPEIVSERTRKKIESSIKTLQYVPHAAARTLASNRSRMIGAIVPSLKDSLFGYSLEEFQTVITNAGYTMVVASSNYSREKERDQVMQMVSHGVDALMFVGLARDADIYAVLKAKNIPYIISWSVDMTGEHPCVGFDNHAAAWQVTEYLLDLGHRDFAMISGYLKDNDRAQNRLQGVRDALASRNVTLPDESLIECPFGVEQGQQAFRSLMSRSNRPTAILCASDPFAYGAIFESKIMGIDVPGEVSITGFDDTWLAPHMSPSLTTLRTPQQQIGGYSASYLISRLTNIEAEVPAALDVELMVRDSCARPVR